MIGPHQGRELKLMLAGKKHLAMFSEAYIEGENIPEEIIPEKAFAPYVENGRLARISGILYSPKSPIPILYVLFTLPDHEWRARAFLWIKKESLEGRRPFDDAYEFFVGRLLDYDEEDIRDFIENVR